MATEKRLCLGIETEAADSDSMTFRLADFRPEVNGGEGTWKEWAYYTSFRLGENPSDEELLNLGHIVFARLRAYVRKEPGSRQLST